jgi:L-ascorbate metabolism protein UlaG (beta-lactamase superfamily)
MIKIKYVGHSTLLIETDIKIIIDPYLKGKGREGFSRYNPNAILSVEDVEQIGPDLILLTHGHGDHFGQTFELLERTDARLVASNRICNFLKKKFSEERLMRIEPNEELKINDLNMLALEAKHKHDLEGFGGDMLGLFAYRRYTPCGTNMGYLISIKGKKMYHSGDTYTVRGVHNPDIAFLSMDGLRTLNEKEAIEVIREIKPKIVVPIHYKYLDNGKKTIEKVKGIVKYEEVLFMKMAYGEDIQV